MIYNICLIYIYSSSLLLYDINVQWCFSMLWITSLILQSLSRLLLITWLLDDCTVIGYRMISETVLTMIGEWMGWLIVWWNTLVHSQLFVKVDVMLIVADALSSISTIINYQNIKIDTIIIMRDFSPSQADVLCWQILTRLIYTMVVCTDGTYLTLYWW